MKLLALLKLALSNEPFFVLRAQDKTAILVLDKWVSENVARLGPDHPKILSARTKIYEFSRWQVTKLPD